MKKSYLFGFIAMAALTISSCSNDEYVSNVRFDSPIEFGTYLGRDAQTRASVITVNELATQGFGVFAYYTDESSYVNASTPESGTKGEDGYVAAKIASPCNYMYNQFVSKSGDAWTYSPVKYWPNDPNDKLTFFAYAPYDDADANNNESGYDNISFSVHTTTTETTTDGETTTTSTVMSGDPIITFNVNNDVKKQQDLLISTSATQNLTKNKAGVDGIYVDENVSFTFNHALSRIGFTVKAIVDEVEAGTTPKALDPNTTIVLREVVLCRSQASTKSAAVGSSIFYTSGTINLNQQNKNATVNGNYVQFNWATKTGTQTFNLNNDDFAAQTDFGAIYDEQGFVINSTNSTSANKLNTDDSYIMIIPQEFGNYDDDDQNNNAPLYVYVEYDVITLDGAIGYDGANAAYADLKSKITNHISTPVSINFESGKAYSLNLQLGMTSVKVDASVTAWPTEVGSAVDVPKNTEPAAQS